MNIRPPAVAGVFYPARNDALRASVQQHMSAAPALTSARWPKAIIAPHAGFAYSGPVAASAFSLLAPARKIVKRVVIIGPNHRVAVERVAATSVDAFATSLGNVPVDRAALERLSGLPQVQTFDFAHAPEHSIETHLPFLQFVLEDFSIVPLVVGDTAATDVSEILDLLWGGPETLISISSDLSHFYDYDTARKMDAGTAQAIETLQPDAIRFEHACGRVPIKGLMTLAAKHALKIETKDLRNSGDTAGGRDRVVGYGAWAFYEAGG